MKTEKSIKSEKVMKSFIYENLLIDFFYYSIEYISDTIFNLNITLNMINFCRFNISFNIWIFSL